MSSRTRVFDYPGSAIADLAAHELGAPSAIAPIMLNMFNSNIALDAADTIPGILPAAIADDRTPPMTHREWLSLGILCLAAAENSHSAGNHSKSRYYAALATKCDELAAELPRSARGSIPIPVAVEK